MGISFHWGSAGNLESGSSTRDFERCRKLYKRRVSEEAQCIGPLGRAPLLGTPKDLLKRNIKRDVTMSCKLVSVSIGAPLGNLEGTPLLELFEKK